MTLPPQNSTLPQIYDFPQICAVRCLGATYNFTHSLNSLTLKGSSFVAVILAIMTKVV